MTDFLIRCFVKDNENINDPAVRETYGKFSGIVGIVMNFVLASVKFVVGIFFNSAAVIADAANNLTDSMSAVVTLVGFKLSGKPADKEHPYGHQRMEYISGLLVSFIIIFIGIELFKTSVRKVITPENLTVGVSLFVVLAGTSLVKLWMCFFYKRIGKLISSGVVLASSKDCFNDVIATFAVLLSAVVSYFAGFNFDGYAGAVVALYIIYSGATLVKETVNPLLGAAPSRELIDEICRIIRAAEGVDGMHDLIVHTYGPNKYFASVHVEVDAKQELLAGHEISDNIERDVKRITGVDLVVHLDPVIKDDKAVNDAREMVASILNEIDSRITYHDFRMVEGTAHTNLIFDICVPADLNLSNGELTDTVIHKIHAKDRAFECIITVDKNYGSYI
ncbi:MAG: cation transporter [Ruminococcaceae bacterium]|nr:cation transporter [Oscillospiraceae bacterium]